MNTPPRRPHQHSKFPKATTERQTGKPQTKESYVFFWLRFQATHGDPRHAPHEEYLQRNKSPNHTTFYDASTSNPPMGGEKSNQHPPKTQGSNSTTATRRLKTRVTLPLALDLRLRFHQRQGWQARLLHHHSPTNATLFYTFDTHIDTPNTVSDVCFGHTFALLYAIGVWFPLAHGGNTHTHWGRMKREEE